MAVSPRASPVSSCGPSNWAINTNTTVSWQPHRSFRLHLGWRGCLGSRGHRPGHQRQHLDHQQPHDPRIMCMSLGMLALLTPTPLLRPEPARPITARPNSPTTECSSARTLSRMAAIPSGVTSIRCTIDTSARWHQRQIQAINDIADAMYTTTPTTTAVWSRPPIAPRPASSRTQACSDKRGGPGQRPIE